MFVLKTPSIWAWWISCFIPYIKKIQFKHRYFTNVNNMLQHYKLPMLHAFHHVVCSHISFPSKVSFARHPILI